MAVGRRRLRNRRGDDGAGLRLPRRAGASGPRRGRANALRGQSGKAGFAPAGPRRRSGEGRLLPLTPEGWLMSVQVLMPALSPTMTEGKLAKWLKQEGDAVNSGDVLAEIETDKATMEVEAVDEGVLGRILVPEGTEGVAVNTPIALLLSDGEDASALDAPAAAPEAAAPEAADKEVEVLTPGRGPATTPAPKEPISPAAPSEQEYIGPV